jgi:hypothetical protein
VRWQAHRVAVRWEGGSPKGSFKLQIVGGHAELPHGMNSIGDDAFHGCKSLTTIAIPPSVTTMGRCAFDSCQRLEAVRLPPSLANVSDFAFAGCLSLSDVTIPSSVTYIGTCAFYACPSLTVITIPSTAEVGRGAFDKHHTVIRLPPERMDAQERLVLLGRSVLAYKRTRAALFAWLERSQIRIGAYALGGAGLKRDLEAYVLDFGRGRATVP